LLGQNNYHARLSIKNWKIKDILFPSFFTLVLEGIPSSSRRLESHDFLHPSLSHPPGWPKLESPSFFFPSHLRLLAKPEPPPTDTGDQPDQPPTTASLTLLSSLLLLTTTDCREDDEIKREVEWQKPHLKGGKKTRSRPGSPGSSGSWVDPPGCCTSRSFNKPKPVHVPGQPGPRSTRQARPGLITMLQTSCMN